MDTPIIKRCTGCGQEKPVEAFSYRSLASGHRLSRCRKCLTAASSAWYHRTHADGPKRTPKLSEPQRSEVAVRGKMICAICRQEKPLADYGVTRTGGRTYLRRHCRACMNNRATLWRRQHEQHLWERAVRYKCPRYGITPQEYFAMLTRQNGRCAICDRPLPTKGQTIDHDHRTGAVRGIVHSQCNLIIGNAGDDPQVLSHAIQYLHQHRGVVNTQENFAASAQQNSTLQEAMP